jgi:hypothetical protein
VKDGKVESFVCMGYEQGASVTCLAFQAHGSLLVSSSIAQQHHDSHQLWQQHQQRPAACASLLMSSSSSDVTYVAACW